MYDLRPTATDPQWAEPEAPPADAARRRRAEGPTFTPPPGRRAARAAAPSPAPAPEEVATRAAEGLDESIEVLLGLLHRPDLPPAGPPLAAGTRLGRYELVREIGRGACAAVHEALDLELGRAVAVKVLHPARRSPEAEEALLREARVAAGLRHPDIVEVHDVGRSEAGPYLVLELLRGETLADRIARGPLPPAEAFLVAGHVARALAHAHEAGFLHRDVKPGNVFLAEGGQVKLLDLGLAGLRGHGRPTSGTPAYMAPEQWRGEPVDARTDLFALGVVLHEALTGLRPFFVSGRETTVLLPGEAPPIRDPALPSSAVALVARALAKAPDRRPAGAAIFAESLLAEARRLARGRRRMGAVVAAALLGLVAGGLLGWSLPFPSAPPTPGAARAPAPPTGRP